MPSIARGYYARAAHASKFHLLLLIFKLAGVMSQTGTDLEEMMRVIARESGKQSMERNKKTRASVARREMHQRFSRKRLLIHHTLIIYGKSMVMLPGNLCEPAVGDQP